MDIEVFHDPATHTLSYVVYDRDAAVAVVIDPVLDFDAASGRTSSRSAEAIARFLDAGGLALPYVLDTHAHADHLSAMAWFKQRYGAQTAIGAGITGVQAVFRDLFHLGDTLACDGSQFDLLLEDGQQLDVGPFVVEALHTPGHTPACLSYRIEDALFVGDALFQPDYGTARCDFPGGSAEALYASIRDLYAKLPDETRVFTCHDYRPGGRPLAWESTIGEQRRHNVQLSDTTTREAFVAFRSERDATLSMPDLILPSVQVNVRAGELPPPESNGVSYLKLPLNVFGAPAPAPAARAAVEEAPPRLRAAEPEERRMPEPVREIAAAKAAATLDRYTVIDVREGYEFEGPLGHIDGARLLPLSQIEKHADELAKHQPLLLVCRSGRRSATACERLAEHGCPDATNLADGMIGWNRAEQAVVHSEPKDLTALVDQIVAWVAQVGPLSTEAALEIVRDRFGRQGASYEQPTHAAVEELIGFVDESLAAVNPPDLELSLASFRRTLAVL